MDFYGMSLAGPDGFRVDEFLDFSGGDRDEHLSSSTATATHLFHNITLSSASGSQFQYGFNDNSTITTDFTDHFCVPSDDVAELEWLSKFVDDSASNFPANNIAGTINFRPETPSFHSRSRTKRTRAPSTNTSWTSTSTPMPTTNTSEKSCETTSEPNAIRRCTHCASEKTPQWRTGPNGPKTLCNACGVRYKSGRLVPEYRPAASPTFVLTQHSNSHRKVMELRRQKEMIIGVNQHQHHYQHHHQHHHQQHLVKSEHQIYAGRHSHRQQHHGSNYEVC